MSDPAAPYTPKANASTLGQAANGMTRNHVIPIAVMRDSNLVQQFLKLPDGGVSIFDLGLTYIAFLSYLSASPCSGLRAAFLLRWDDEWLSARRYNDGSN